MAATLVLLGSACNAAPSTPTAPSEAASGPWAALSCAPPPGQIVHSVAVPGSALRVQVWMDSLTPPPGASVRVGDTYQVRHMRSVPPGVTAMVQVHVGPRVDMPGTFAVVGPEGCGSSLVMGSIPPGDESLRLFVRVWVAPGTVPPGDAIRVFDRAPDYVGSEPVGWTKVP